MSLQAFNNWKCQHAKARWSDVDLVTGKERQDFEAVLPRKVTREYLDAKVEIATLYDRNGVAHAAQVFLDDKTEEGYWCLLPFGVGKRINLTVGIGSRYRFEDGQAIRVKKFTDDPEPSQPEKVTVSNEPKCCK